jgi:hypothetical protein
VAIAELEVLAGGRVAVGDRRLDEEHAGELGCGGEDLGRRNVQTSGRRNVRGRLADAGELGGAGR